ncbi:hypothetical protein BA065_00875 [Nanoarchaeota archaeon NZ13-N]|nr:MAG: hypothetical protein BA065_00875 [Nanoarchaeota archaeon NZ13-N]
MKGIIGILMKVLFEIIVFIIIIMLIIYSINAFALLSNLEDKKYISLVSFIESNIKESGSKVWEDTVTYNPFVYTLYFNFTDGRIYLYKCDVVEQKMVFYNITQDTMIKDLESSNCYSIYASREVLDDKVTVRIEGGSLMELENKRSLYVSLYNLKYSEETTIVNYGGTESTIVTVYGANIKDISTSFTISQGSIIKDTSSYLFGLGDKIWKGAIVSSDCSMYSGYVRCMLDYKYLINQGFLFPVKLTVIVNYDGERSEVVLKAK